MSSGIKLKRKGTTLKKAAKKSTKKAVKKKVEMPTIAELTDIPVDLSSMDSSQISLDLDKMSSEQLDDEAKKALIRSRTAAANKQERLNDIAAGKLVERSEAIDEMKALCLAAVEVLDLMPDQVGPNLYKKSAKQIRERLVKAVDKVKNRFIQKLMDLDNEESSERTEETE